MTKALLSMFLLLMAACAPSTKHLIDGGRITLKYSTTPNNILKLIKDSQQTIALPNGYEQLKMTELSNGVIRLTAKPPVTTGGSQNQEIMLTVTAEQRNEYTHLILKTNSVAAAESLRSRIVNLLDANYLRYQEGLLPKLQLAQI